MIVQTDVTCLYCGHVSWRVELERGRPWQSAEVLWPEGDRLPARPQCTRCGGPVYLDNDYRQVRISHREWQALVAQARAGDRVQPALASHRVPKQTGRWPNADDRVAA